MGKEVTIHEKAIHAHGWSGYGYMIVDPETGAGAYLIEGKGNGGVLSAGDASILLSIAGLVFTLPFLGVGVLVLLLLALSALVLAVVEVLNTWDHCGDMRDDAALWGTIAFSSAAAVLGAIGQFGKAFIVLIVSWLSGKTWIEGLKCR